ncbi:hypothetical protein DLAC_02615 [Tieghemostelium lacteum]|uniref:ethanolamine kinase n=1 Tax=Tieghemostelium lacteum TaxID=361077 RepID=A0A152A2Y7_TIELA|nr:hypothetical protein DLAC_02615 [Tieghemostelium lacteum]|eukprot:KYR00596.1 hypothetical protein DLAC_02615 [Tieghemostelium lacteum]
MYEDLLLPQPSHVQTQVHHLPDENADNDEGSKALLQIMKELVDDNLNHEITFKPMVGGVTNTLFKSSFTNNKGNNKSVIIRLYGKGSENLIDRKAESHIQYLLSKNGVGPRFYGTFENGCIYGYIEGDQLQLEDLANRDKLKLIASEVSRWHSLDLDDLNREPAAFRYVRSWIKTSVHSLETLGDIGLDLDYYIKESEHLIEFLKNRYQNESKHVTFCHNDLIPRNMIYDNDNDQVRFIDFEYSGYNYRGYDLGNFFCEFSGLDLDYSRYPTEETQKLFLKYYLSFQHGYNDISMVDSNELHQLYIEANHFTLVSHLMWGFWGIVQSANSTIDFDYIDYSKKRFKQYDLVKNKVFDLK